MRTSQPSPPAYWDRASGPRLAYRHRHGAGPTIVFLPGYGSDMEGTKALALEAWARDAGRAFLRFDYGGHGASEGRFEEGTLASWRDDALALIDGLTQGPILVVGSSMGGWLALLIARARPERVAALVGIATAADFTDWGFTADEQAVMQAEGRLFQLSPYGEEPRIVTRAFWESGQALCVLNDVIAVDCPVRLLQGQRDDDVPWTVAPRVAGQLRSSDVQTLLIKDGDHRLSRDADIALLVGTVARLLDSLP